ncbi:MAG: 4Fe-4S dicluster domain-containing protein [Sporomusaceae bacterium]|nr:4Fe-4S dicluster domain-containing protein [Sporomusaceae bacterium]
MKKIWVDKDKCLGCKSCELQCAIERDSVSRTLAGAVRETPKPIARVSVQCSGSGGFPIQCRHCQDAACLKACPSGALQRDKETDMVFIDASRCRGCWMCVMSCPFGAIVPAGAYKVAVKCDGCRHMEEPACVNACPVGALLYGDDAEFQQVLLTKRKQAAVFAAGAAAAAVSLDMIREEQSS